MTIVAYMYTHKIRGVAPVHLQPTNIIAKVDVAHKKINNAVEFVITLRKMLALGA